jgi:hypothetical protein
MSLYTFLRNLLSVLTQIANKMGLQKKMLYKDRLADTVNVQPGRLPQVPMVIPD